MEGQLPGSRRPPHGDGRGDTHSDGILIYNGAIDNQPTPDPATVAGATNYVSTALTAAMSRQAVTIATTQPYGCAVKYAR